MRKGQGLLTTAFWIVMILLIAWIILKGAGILQSPTLIEISPFAFLGLLIYIERLETRLYIDKRLSSIENRLTKLEAKIEMILQFLKIKKK